MGVCVLEVLMQFDSGAAAETCAMLVLRGRQQGCKTSDQDAHCFCIRMHTQVLGDVCFAWVATMMLCTILSHPLQQLCSSSINHWFWIGSKMSCQTYCLMGIACAYCI